MTTPEALVLLALVFIPVSLTIAMFLSKSMMLGFPCATFWAILGGRFYELSTATWDIFYLLFFACLLGMTVFTALAAFALRTKKEEEAEGDELSDEGKDDLHFIDEGPEEESGVSKRTKGIRARAKKRGGK